jgi:hypothetical protein
MQGRESDLPFISNQLVRRCHLYVPNAWRSAPLPVLAWYEEPRAVTSLVDTQRLCKCNHMHATVPRDEAACWQG